MKVLYVGIAFPPKRDPESLQVAKYCKYLAQTPGLEMEALTSADPTLFMEPDPALNEYRKGIKTVHLLRIIENRYTNFLLRMINPEWLQYPDAKWWFWFQSSGRINAISRPDIIYSRSYPVSSTLRALKLKKKWKVPWILHLSDPWALSSQKSISPVAALTGKARKWNLMKQRECFQVADRISFTSHKTIDLYTSVYPEFTNKFVYFPNVFDDAKVVNNPIRQTDKLLFVYTGGFGEARTPTTFLKGIRKFWESKINAEDKDSIRFIFAGEMTLANRAIFDSYKDIPAIEHRGIVPYEDALTLQRSAHILVNIDSNMEDPADAVFFPSKILDYLIAQRRILAITNSYSTTHEVVEGRLGDCFEFDEIDELADYIGDVLQKFKRKELAYFLKAGDWPEFSAANNARRLAQLFKEILDVNPVRPE